VARALGARQFLDRDSGAEISTATFSCEGERFNTSPAPEKKEQTHLRRGKVRAKIAVTDGMVKAAVVAQSEAARKGFGNASQMKAAIQAAADKYVEQGGKPKVSAAEMNRRLKSLPAYGSKEHDKLIEKTFSK
jgi:hypothetical protein